MDKQNEEQNFGEYIAELRKARGHSLRKTAEAIGVSAQFYSEVEKGHRTALVPDRMGKLKEFFQLSNEEANLMLDKGAKGRKTKEFDFSDYIVQRDYAMSALRVAKELDADEEDWQKFVDELKQRKECESGDN